MDWQQIWSEFENWLKPATDLVQQKPLYALISILANIIQVGAFLYAILTLRRSNKREKEERELKEQQLQVNRKIEEQLSIYQEMFKKTKIAAKIEEELEESLTTIQEKIRISDEEIKRQDISIQEREKLKAEKELAIKQLEEERKKLLAQKTQDIRHFEERLKQVVATAQNEALREIIKKRLEAIEREVSEIENLKSEYQLKDKELNLPDEVKTDLQESFRNFVPVKKKADGLPQSYLLQIVILVLLVYLLPSPVDTIILLISLVPLFAILVDLVKQLKNERLNWRFQRSYKILLFLSLYALWFSLFAWLYSILKPFVNQAYAYISNVLSSPQDTIPVPISGGSSDSFSYTTTNPYSEIFILWINIVKTALDLSPYVLPFLFSIIDYVRKLKPIKQKILDLQNSESELAQENESLS